MGNILQFDKYKVGTDSSEAIKKAEEMMKNPGAYSREERRKIMQDMRYETEANLQDWSEEEKLNNRKEFDREAEEAREMFDREFRVIYHGGDGLSEFEKKKTEKYMAEHPEDEAIITGMMNMIVEGINDPEHTTEYAD